MMILDTAAEVFAAQGYDAGNVDTIGARMGISGPAIYRHFPRKQDILVELVVRAVERALAELEVASVLPLAPAGRMKEMVARLARCATTEQAVLASLHTTPTELDAANRARLTQARDHLLARWSGELRALRPALDDEGAKVRVLACFAIVGSLSAQGTKPELLELLLMALVSA